jgi:hypothetical protein
MFVARRALVCVVLSLLGVAAGCGGDPPDKEMQQAQGALDAARAAGADQYAHEEFTAAQDALKKSQDAVEQRDYRLALTYALDSRERAQNAAREAADHKATARSDAERALADATEALNEAKARLRAAEALHLAQRRLADPRKAIDTAEKAVQKARADFSHGDYLETIADARPVRASLRSVARDLDTTSTPPARRKR